MMEMSWMNMLIVVVVLLALYYAYQNDMIPFMKEKLMTGGNALGQRKIHGADY